MNKTVLTIEGMSCQHCVAAVDRALRELAGVDVESVEIGLARISHGSGTLDPVQLRAAVQEAGFRLEELEQAP